MPKRRFIIRKETKAMGAAQIMIGLINSALGTLWVFLHQLEEKSNSVGTTLMHMITIYSFVSASFFINSGSCSVIQGVPTTCKLMLAIVMNIISVIVAIVGIFIAFTEFSAFEAKGEAYIWSNMAGMVLLQYTILTVISELSIACTLIYWCQEAFSHEQFPEETPCISESLQSESLSLKESEICQNDGE